MDTASSNGSSNGGSSAQGGGEDEQQPILKRRTDTDDEDDVDDKEQDEEEEEERAAKRPRESTGGWLPSGGVTTGGLGLSKPEAFVKKQSRVGSDYQVDPAELIPQRFDHSRLGSKCPWRNAEPPKLDESWTVPRTLPEEDSPKKKNGAAQKSIWVLEPVPDATEVKDDLLEVPPRSEICLNFGSTILGRKLETRWLSDLRLSRHHVEVVVDESENVWAIPKHQQHDCICINKKKLPRAGGRVPLERGDVLCLRYDEYGFRLRHATAAPFKISSTEAEGDEELAECLWRPARTDKEKKALADLLSITSPGAEAEALFALHAASFSPAQPGSLASRLATRTGGVAGLEQHWTSAALKAFSASLMRNRADFRYVAMELQVPLKDLLNFYYAVWKPRHDNSTFKALLHARQVEAAARGKKGVFAPPDDGHANECALCNGDGELLCCDTCELAYHLHCLKIDSVPDGEWKCPRCLASPGGAPPPATTLMDGISH